jgi:hypothetical protein
MIDAADTKTLPLIPVAEGEEVWIPSSFTELALMQTVTIPERFGADVGRIEFIAYDYCVIRFPDSMIDVCTDVSEIRFG